MFEDELENLESDTEYEFRAVAEANGDEDEGDVESFTTEEGEDPDGELTIDTFDVQNRSNPRWTRARVTWEVSSGADDGELEIVTSELHNGEPFDEEEEGVSGFEADGEHDLRADADGLDEDEAEVTLTVETVDEESVSETKPLVDN